MIYNVLMGMLNPTYSHTHWPRVDESHIDGPHGSRSYTFKTF